MTIDIYKKTILDCLPRIISNLDRNRFSPSFGCFDRNFWHYKIVDTPSARLQEGVLTLAILYLNPENPLFYREDVKEWIRAGLRFWLKIQDRAGAFNEWYPYEKSFVATAFSSYAVSETVLLLPDIKEKKEVSAGLKAAANFLCSRRDEQAFNQNTGALAALYNIFLLTGDVRYQKECERMVEFLKKNQNKEGWFFEYGGADIGYLSLSIDYLAKYYLKSKDEKVRPILDKALSFISHFIHPDGSVGGIYGSRNTSYFIPSGIEILANLIPLARKISFVLREGIQNNNIISPGTLDDRYLIQNSYTYLEASRQLNQGRRPEGENDVELPSSSFKDQHFPNAGILIKSTPRFYCIINYKKGGAFYIFNRSKKVGVYNSGISLKRGEKTYSSSYLCDKNEIVFSSDGKTFSIRGKLKEVVGCYSTPFRFVVLRTLLGIMSFTLGLADFIKSVLRSLLISRKIKSSFYFERSFYLDDNISVKDKFPPGIFKQGWVGGIQELIYTPSSRYFNNALIFSNGQPIKKEELLQGEHETIYYCPGI